MNNEHFTTISLTLVDTKQVGCQIFELTPRSFSRFSKRSCTTRNKPQRIIHSFWGRSFYPLANWSPNRVEKCAGLKSDFFKKCTNFFFSSKCAIWAWWDSSLNMNSCSIHKSMKYKNKILNHEKIEKQMYCAKEMLIFWSSILSI